MHEMAIDIDQTGSIRLFVHQMIVPDLVVERTRFHGSITLLRTKGEAACKRPAFAGAIKVPPAPLSAGRKTATAVARDRPGQSAELWKPWLLYSQSIRVRQRSRAHEKGPTRGPLKHRSEARITSASRPRGLRGR